MIEPKHTPTPWKKSLFTDGMEIYNGEGVRVTVCRGHEYLANAELIVRAVNAHEALVSALTETLRALRAHIASDAARTGIVAEYFCPCTKNEVARAEAALRAARGEK